MNNDIFKGNWKQLKGKAKDQWGKLTDDDLERVEGKYENLVGQIQEKYGKSKEESEQQVNDFMNKK